MGITLVLSIGGTAIIATAIKAVIGLRPDSDAEEEGLDQVDHGEAGYHLEDGGSASSHLESAGDRIKPGIGSASAQPSLDRP